MNDFDDYQTEVGEWLKECFPEEIVRSIPERNIRFLEEAIELVQANGMRREYAHALVDYVYGRPDGNLVQEVGGLMVTLSALCEVCDINLSVASYKELRRIQQPHVIEKIRAKQALKPIKGY